MRSIYKVVLAGLVLIITTPLACAQQSSFHQEVFTQARPGARVAVDGSGYHQISWVTSGGPGACYLALDYSSDGMVWYLGGTMPIRDCTRSGSSPVVSQRIRYVRMNLNTLSGTSAIRATYAGFQTNPGPTGTVTSVFGRTGDVIADVGDYNVAQITGAAGLNSPNFTGSPTSPTPSPGDNSNRIATTSFVDAMFSTCCNGGGGTTAGVSSFNGRTGAVVPQAQDYAAFFAPISGGGGTGGNATGLTFGTTTIPLGTPVPSSGQFLTYNGTSIVGTTSAIDLSHLTSNTLPKVVNAAFVDSAWLDDGTNTRYAGSSVGVGGGNAACGPATGCFAATEAAGQGTPMPGSDYLRADSATHAFVISHNGSPEAPLPLPTNSGTAGQVPIANGDGSFTWSAAPATPSGGGEICDKKAMFNKSTTGSTQLIALVSGQKIYVCGWTVFTSANTAVDVKLVVGTGTNCGTNAADFSETVPLQAPDNVAPVGAVIPAPANVIDAAPAGDALCVNTTGALLVRGKVWYTQH